MKSRLRILFFLTTALLSCKTSFQISKKESGQYKFSDSTNTEIDSSIYSEIAPYREKMQSAMNEVLAVSTTSLERGLPESKLGNFLSDACMSSAKEKNMQADFAVFNTGGLRRPLPSGNITRGDVFELMPFENELVILWLRGDKLNELLQNFAKMGGQGVAGLRMTISERKAVDITIGGLPLDMSKTYTIATNDYLAGGNDNMEQLAEHEKRLNTGVKVRNMLLDFIKSETQKGNMIQSKMDGRIKINE